MPNNLIRVKQLDQNELSGFVSQSIASTGLLNDYFVTKAGDQTISGIKTFAAKNADDPSADSTISLYPSGRGSIAGSFIASNSNLTIAGSNAYQNISFSDENVRIIAGNEASVLEVSHDGSIYLNGQIVGNTGAFQKLYADNLVYNTGDQTISGAKIFISSGIFSLSGAAPLRLPNNPLSVVGSGNTYLQLNIQNRASGANATADLVITANNGNDSSNYINLGINNSGYNDVGFTNGTGYDGYLFINGGNLDIATQTPNKYIEFQIGGTTQNRTIARIDNSGINIVSGTYRLNDTPYNTSTITFISSNANLTVGQNYISNVGAGYSATVTERLVPIMDTCTARKASISLLNSGPGNSIVGITGLFINTSSVPNQTGIINSAISASAGQNQYTFTGAFATPININAGDNVVCSLNSNNTAINVRTAATIYLYN